MYYVLPRVFVPPLRRDPIPFGAYIIPWMKPYPSIDDLQRISPSDTPWDVDVVMTGALKLDMTFNIALNNESRVIPSTLYLGHDTDYLYVGGEFRGMYKNPYSSPTWIVNNYFQIFFDVASDGVLTFPESGSRVTVALYENASWRTGKSWGYHDTVWHYVKELKREAWIFGEDYYWPNAQPAFSIRDSDIDYDNSTGTLIAIFSRYLWRSGNADINALQMKRGERWVMSFLLELGYARSGLYQDSVDGWPQKFFPYLTNDSSRWPKLVIDLSNPPPEFLT